MDLQVPGEVELTGTVELRNRSHRDAKRTPAANEAVCGLSAPPILATTRECVESFAGIR